jgi:hypothetical protein
MGPNGEVVASKREGLSRLLHSTVYWPLNPFLAPISLFLQVISELFHYKVFTIISELTGAQQWSRGGR